MKKLNKINVSINIKINELYICIYIVFLKNILFRINGFETKYS